MFHLNNMKKFGIYGKKFKMFGYTIIKKTELEMYKNYYNRQCWMGSQRYWFSGWPSIMKLLEDLLFSHKTIEQIRREFAEREGTDEYGQPK